MEKNLVVAAESYGFVGCVGADDVAVEVGFVGNAEAVGIVVGACGREVVGSDVGVDGEFAEERSHAACYACHAAEWREEYGFGAWMWIEGVVDAHFCAV